MTPRLKILIVGLVLSLIYSISDYIIRNRDKPVVEVKREVKKRPKTARVDLNRIATIKAINISLVLIFLILVKSKKAMIYFIFKNAFNKNRTKI